MRSARLAGRRRSDLRRIDGDGAPTEGLAQNLPAEALARREAFRRRTAEAARTRRRADGPYHRHRRRAGADHPRRSARRRRLPARLPRPPPPPPPRMITMSKSPTTSTAPPAPATMSIGNGFFVALSVRMFFSSCPLETPRAVVVDDDVRDRVVAAAVEELVLVGHLERDERVADLERAAAHVLLHERLHRVLDRVRVAARELRIGLAARGEEVRLRAVLVARPAERRRTPSSCRPGKTGFAFASACGLVHVDVERPLRRVDADRHVLERRVADDRPASCS